MNVIDSIVTQAAGIAAVRRDIHAHPELCFEEVRTADVVAGKLTEWGIPIHRGLGKTGVVGIVHGRDGGACGRAIGLRADMDALPMQEFNTFSHASQNKGKMHACGHDGHTAMLLAAAQHFAKQRLFDGTVYLIFQPAEEGGGGGELAAGQLHSVARVAGESDRDSIKLGDALGLVAALGARHAAQSSASVAKLEGLSASVVRRSVSLPHLGTSP